MIELDEERLDRMRQVPAEQLTEPPETALQQVVFKAPAQHEHAAVESGRPPPMAESGAVWNSEATGQQITGEVLHRAEDEFGLEAGDSFHGGQFMALVRRGGAQPEQFAPFALKAHNAAQQLMVKEWIVKSGIKSHLRKQLLPDSSEQNVVAILKSGDSVYGEFLFIRRASRESGFLQLRQLEPQGGSKWLVSSSTGTALLRKHPTEAEAQNVVGYAMDGELVDGEFLFCMRRGEKRGGYVKVKHLKPVKERSLRIEPTPDPVELAKLARALRSPGHDGQRWAVLDAGHDGAPVGRIGVATIWGELRIACTTGSCSFPSVPVLLLNKQQGEELLQLCRSGRSVTGDFTVKSDPYPRRSLPKKLCQACGLFCSGIGVMYGIIQCFAVEVGGEFLAAELAARDIGIRCVCIDVDLNRFWSRLGWSLLPTPCNLLNSLLSWLAFPRVFFQDWELEGLDDRIWPMTPIFLHGASFSVKTWLAFLLAGACASFITNSLPLMPCCGEDTGLIESDDREEAQAYVMLAIEMYMLPQVYSAVAASRDEAMYHSMVRKCQEFAAKRLVVVVGAGHANGILQYAREFGL
eukprot:g3674.t1